MGATVLVVAIMLLLDSDMAMDDMSEAGAAMLEAMDDMSEAGAAMLEAMLEAMGMEATEAMDGVAMVTPTEPQSCWAKATVAALGCQIRWEWGKRCLRMGNLPA